MAQPEADAQLTVTRASYDTDAAAQGLPTIANTLDLAEGSGARSTTVLYAAKSAFRWDVIGARARPVISIVRPGAGPLWLIDHKAKTYQTLEVSRTGPSEAPEIAGESSSFGPTLSLIVSLTRRSTVHVRVLATAVFPALAPWWQLCFPGAVPRNYQRRLPVDCALRMTANGSAIARLVLRSLETTSVPTSFFRPPDRYRLQKGKTLSRSMPVPPRPAPQPIQGLGRESSIGALLGGGSAELVKLQLRDEVVERVRTAVNDITARIDKFTGSGFQLDLAPLLDSLATPGPMTPPGTAPIADRLLLRALFWHWASRLRRIFDSDALRTALWQIVDALQAIDFGGAATVEPAANTPMEDVEFFHSMRDFIVANGSACAAILDNIRDSDLTPAATIAVIATQDWQVNGDEARIARAWFDHEFRYVSLQPEVGFTQSGGHNRGWRTNGYIAEGLAQLIDIELEIDSVDLEFGRRAVLGPSTPIDDTDPRFQAIDAVENITPGTRKRAGFATTLSLNSIEVSGNFITTPARTPAVAALALLAPHELARLWSYTDATVDIGSLTIDVIVYFEQERLSPAGPTLKVWITNVAAARLDVTGTFLSPSVLLIAVITPILNELLDHFSPALLDQLTLEFFRGLDKFLGFIEQSIAAMFNRTLPPRPPRATPDFERTVQQAVTRGFTVRENIRLQNLLNLNREDVVELLTGNLDSAEGEAENVARGRLDEFRNNWPEGQTGCEVVNEISGYRLGLAICRLGAGPFARALVHPPVGVSQSGDLSLLLSALTLGQMLGGTRFDYRGDVRVTDGSPAVLAQLPVLDWWQHAQQPELLGPRPTDLRDGPPQLPPGPSTGDSPHWRAYWSVIDIGGPLAQLVPVFNPTPDTHVAEIPIVVTVTAGVTTYTAVNVERCGPDLTRLAGELERPRLGDPGRFRPPAGPGEPRPRPDQPAFDVEVGFERVPNTLEPAIITATALEHSRVRVGNGNSNGHGSGELLDIEGALFARPGFGGAGFDSHCRVITAWDVKEREVWLNARLELRLPVFLGFGNHGPEQTLRDHDFLGIRAHLPILTYRFGTEPVSITELTLQAAGALAGLAQGENPGWLARLLADHALAIVRNSSDRHRLGEHNPLRYAYGIRTRVLQPENFEPLIILAMHPTHWTGADPRPLTDRNPPDLRFETFGSSPDSLNIAINLFLTESLLDKFTM
jgi:hypothetical protein